MEYVYIYLHTMRHFLLTLPQTGHGHHPKNYSLIGNDSINNPQSTRYMVYVWSVTKLKSSERHQILKLRHVA